MIHPRTTERTGRHGRHPCRARPGCCRQRRGSRPVIVPPWITEPTGQRGRRLSRARPGCRGGHHGRTTHDRQSHSAPADFRARPRRPAVLPWVRACRWKGVRTPERSTPPRQSRSIRLPLRCPRPGLPIGQPSISLADGNDYHKVRLYSCARNIGCDRFHVPPVPPAPHPEPGDRPRKSSAGDTISGPRRRRLAGLGFERRKAPRRREVRRCDPSRRSKPDGRRAATAERSGRARRCEIRRQSRARQAFPRRSARHPPVWPRQRRDGPAPVTGSRCAGVRSIGPPGHAGESDNRTTAFAQATA